MEKLDQQKEFTKETVFSVLDKELYQLYTPSLVTRYATLVENSGFYKTYLIVKEDTFRFYRLMLEGLIHLNFQEKVCLRCGTILDDYYDRYCQDCVDKYERDYKNCLFHSPLSVHNSVCTIEDPPCHTKENLHKCFSKYYLYFGRFGESIKVGISRLTYGKYKYRRVIDQGLNEAIIVYPFNSLSEVTSYERLLIDDLGLKEHFTFEDKVENLLEPSFIQITDIYPLNQIQELFYNKKLKHLTFYRDNPLEDILSSSFSIRKKKILDTLQGTTIFTQGNIGLIKFVDDLIFFDISKFVGRIIERRDLEW